MGCVRGEPRKGPNLRERRPRYAAILFDLMDTLVCNPVLDGRVASFFQEPLVGLAGALDQTTWVDFELGLIDEAAFARRARLDRRPIDLPGLRTWLRAHYDWKEGMETLLTELKAAAVEMHILSNYPVWYRLVEDSVACSRYVKWSFLSCETGVRKPDLAAFRGAADGLCCDLESLLLVDDMPANCAAARSIGMDAIEFVGSDALRQSLRERGLLA